MYLTRNLQRQTMAGLLQLSRTLLISCSIVWVLLTTRASADFVEFGIEEEQITGTMVGGIIEPSGIAGRVPGPVSELVFGIFDADSTGHFEYFSVHSQTGELSIAQRIDREDICEDQEECLLICGVSATAGHFFESIIIHITVTDINDNKPIFPDPVKYLTIFENSDTDFAVDLPLAFDEDIGVNDVQSYELEPQSALFDVTITPIPDGSKRVQLVLLERLDREVQNSYQIYLRASDGGTPKQSSLMLLNITVGDHNDNVATFRQLQYIADVMENLEVPSVVITVEATDEDSGEAGTILYSFTTNTLNKYGEVFSIDSDTGEITLIQALDYETKKEYVLSVMAEDSTDNPKVSDVTATVNVHVHDVNDFIPEIAVNTLTSNGQVKVKENSMLHTFVAHVSVVDKDSGLNGQVSCGLNNNKYSLIHIGGTQYKIVTSSGLDRENRSLDQIQIDCRDEGDPYLSASEIIHVSILDDNDNEPEFEKETYQYYLQENSAVGENILTVSASDRDVGPNAMVRYSIWEPEARELFDIHPSSGTIKTVQGLDYESQQELMFHVVARDGGEPSRSSSATVQIQVLDSNDNAPQFTQANDQVNFIVVENLPAGTRIGEIQATDADSSPYDDIEYNFVDASPDILILFELESRTGVLKSKTPYNREVKALYQFHVKAYNPDSPDMTSSTVVNIYIEDINDESPEFLFPNTNNHTIQVSRDLQAGDLVTQVRATDQDDGNNAWLSFSINGGNDDGFFVIGDNSGAISATRDLSQAPYSHFNLSIKARDNGSPSRETYEWLVIALNATDVVEEGFPANMIILVCLVSITGILMVLLLIAIIWLVYKSRYHAHQHRKYLSQQDHEFKTPPVEIIDRLDTTNIQNNLNVDYTDHGFKSSQKDEGRRGPMNSHTSADSGFDEHTEISMSPHGKHVTFHVEGPTESSDFIEQKGRHIQEGDQASNASEDGSNTDSGCVLSETTADDILQERHDDVLQKNPQRQHPVFHVKQPMFYKLCKPSPFSSHNSKSKSSLSQGRGKTQAVPTKVKDVRNRAKLDKLVSHHQEWPDVCKTPHIIATGSGDVGVVEPHMRSFSDCNSVLNYKMHTDSSQRCASELTDDTSTTSGSYVITGEDPITC